MRDDIVTGLVERKKSHRAESNNVIILLPSQHPPSSSCENICRTIFFQLAIFLAFISSLSLSNDNSCKHVIKEIMKANMCTVLSWLKMQEKFRALRKSRLTWKITKRCPEKWTLEQAQNLEHLLTCNKWLFPSWTRTFTIVSFKLCFPFSSLSCLSHPLRKTLSEFHSTKANGKKEK